MLSMLLPLTNTANLFFPHFGISRTKPQYKLRKPPLVHTMTGPNSRPTEKPSMTRFENTKLNTSLISIKFGFLVSISTTEEAATKPVLMPKVCLHFPNTPSFLIFSGLSNVAFAWMVQQLGPHLAFEPWTWGDLGIGGYQRSVMLEERMYNSMKNMPRQEQKEYRGLITKTATENFKDSLSDWGAWIWDGMRRSLGLYKAVKLVPVQPDKITDPQPSLVDDKGNLILPRWGVSEYQDSYTAMYRVMGAPVIRTPGESSDRSREGGLPLRELGQTNEYIHPSVWWRYQTMKNEKGDMKYVSKALLGFKRQQDLKYGSYGYWKSDTQVWVPEWFMKPSNDYLMRKGLETYTDKEVDGGLWQYAEWTYTELVDASDDLEEQLARFYVAAMDAKEEMEIDGRVFPFGVTREMVKEEAVKDEAAKEERTKGDAVRDEPIKGDAIKGEA